MKNLLVIVITVLSLHCQAQDSVVNTQKDHTIYILFTESDYAYMSINEYYDYIL